MRGRWCHGAREWTKDKRCDWAEASMILPKKEQETGGQRASLLQCLKALCNCQQGMELAAHAVRPCCSPAARAAGPLLPGCGCV